MNAPRRTKAVKSFFLLLSLALVTCAASAARHVDASTAKQTRLIFELDQGTPNGIIENLDMSGLDRTLDVLKKFQGKYETYALFSPLTAKQDNLRKVLTRTAARGVPFFLDVYSSDGMTIGNIITPAHGGADPSHGLNASVDDLRALKEDKKIGPYFAGIRFFELMAEDFTVKNCLDSKSINWCDHFKKNIRDKDVLTHQIATPLLDFAKNQHMLVLWADWKWDRQTAAQQQIITDLLADGRYRDTVILAYANNLPNETARQDDSNWQDWRKVHTPWVGKEIRGLGLSDQSWLCDVHRMCATNDIDRWMENAMQAGTTTVQLESPVYFFELPANGDTGYPDSPQWAENSGKPSEQLVVLAEALGVDLTSSPPYPLSATMPNRAICTSISVSKHVAVAGEAVQVTATFRNAGTNAWDASTLSLAPLPANAWQFANFAAPGAKVNSHESVTVSLSATAPAKPGPARLDVRLRTGEGKPFDGFCSMQLAVKPKF